MPELDAFWPPGCSFWIDGGGEDTIVSSSGRKVAVLKDARSHLMTSSSKLKICIFYYNCVLGCIGELYIIVKEGKKWGKTLQICLELWTNLMK